MKKLIRYSVVLIFFCLLFSVLCPLNYAAVPHLINYQGRLTDSSGAPLEGAHNLTFRIYDAETAGSLLWEEAHSSLLIQKGIFSVLLGSVTSLNLAFDKPYWLEIKVGDEVMSPRQQITSAGYAIRAEEVESLPRGIITMWSGTLANIPSGWALCDGTNGTPDLKEKFVMGVSNGENPGASGGASTHNHSAAANSSSDQVWVDDSSGGNDHWVSPSGHSHSITVNEANNLPPYYKVAYIMKL